jgi:UDP-3-O-[3-hydroxymyristoyl] N-acetylglucosamine deacetylase
MRIAQRTLGKHFRVAGVGLHSGLTSVVTVLPGDASSGITFFTSRGAVRAHVRNAVSTGLTTSLHSSVSRVTVHTVEHLLAAFSAHGVDNARIMMEPHRTDICVPILDGSAKPFSDLLTGNVITQPGTIRKRIIVRQPVEVVLDSGERYVKLWPSDDVASGFDLNVTIDYGTRIRTGKGGQQTVRFRVNDDSSSRFHCEIASARTFCFQNDVQQMLKSGLIKGGSLQNAVVFGQEHGDCLTSGGLRFDDEPCRHKLLDCIGDLSLAGAPLIGRVDALRPGHEINRQALIALFSDSDNYEIVE